MRFLLPLTIISLILPLRLKTDLVLLRPFEVLTVLMCLALLVSGRWLKISVPKGFIALLPFFAWHVISAGTVSVDNMLREGLQMAVIILFAFALSQESKRLNIEHAIKLITWAMAMVFLYTIIWHVANGYWVGWKHLLDTRLSLVFLPVVIAGLILFTKSANSNFLWLLWIALLPLLVLSGERKALVIQLLLMILLLARGRLVPVVAWAMVGFVGLIVVSTLIDNPYLQRQINSLINPASTGNYEYVIDTGKYLPGDSLSNVQRSFALNMSKQMFSETPVLGVGTNQYVRLIDDLFPNIPETMKLDIHGEFQRVITENGIIGISLYLLVWIVAWLRLVHYLKIAHTEGLITLKQSKIFPLLFLVPCALFLGTEASGSRSFVVLVLISLSPDIVRMFVVRASISMKVIGDTAGSELIEHKRKPA